MGFSGGIDSQATALLVLQWYPAKDVILLNSTAGGNEHPITSQFIRDYSVNVFPVVMIDALVGDLGSVGTRPGITRERRAEFDDSEELTFDKLAYIKGRFPSTKARFCTEYLKLSPQKRWIAENHFSILRDGFTRYIGLRREEGGKRKDIPDSTWDTYFDCEIHYPVASWTKRECFDFCRDHGQEINPLYKMGFERVGCAPCINAGKEDIYLWSTRSPDMIEKLRGWEVANGRTFFAPCVPGMKINWIDDVVQWAKTSRGGKQPLLMFNEADAAAHACLSRYGLCE